MNTDTEEPIYKLESRQIVGAAMEVLNAVVHGFHEKPYENALVVEFRLRGISYQQQRQFDIFYKNEKVGNYVPDLIVHEKVVVDTKVIEGITDRDVGQMWNYLKISGSHLGYILNYKHSKLNWKRVIK